MIGRTGVALLALLAGMDAAAQTAPGADALAAKFGAREAVQQISLAPDGAHIAYITPAGTRGSAAVVVDLASGKSTPIGLSDGARMTPLSCGWASGMGELPRSMRTGSVVGER